MAAYLAAKQSALGAAIEAVKGGCSAVLRPSRRALRALLRMRYVFDEIKKNPSS